MLTLFVVGVVVGQRHQGLGAADPENYNQDPPWWYDWAQLLVDKSSTYVVEAMWWVRIVKSQTQCRKDDLIE